MVDALDEQAVEAHARAVVAEAGSLDVSFNLITRGGRDDHRRLRSSHHHGDHHDLHHRARRGAPRGAGTQRRARPGPWAAGIPETFTPENLAAVNSDLALDDAAFQGLLDNLDAMRMLRRSPRLAQVADVAAFLASDRAAAITATFTNVTGMFPS